jgi:hypothetical protein
MDQAFREDDGATSMNWSDFLFPASKPLKQAAAQGTPTPAATCPNCGAGLDMAKLAQQSADQQLGQEAKDKAAKAPTPKPVTVPDLMK